MSIFNAPLLLDTSIGLAAVPNACHWGFEGDAFCN